MSVGFGSVRKSPDLSMPSSTSTDSFRFEKDHDSKVVRQVRRLSELLILEELLVARPNFVRICTNFLPQNTDRFE